MDAHSLRLFVAVADHLHFGRAARALGMSQPPLSQQIKRLEESIGGRLFERTKRRVELSPLGSALLGDARDILTRLEQLERRAKTLVAGHEAHVRIGYIGPALRELVAPAIATLRRSHSNLVVELARGTTASQIKDVESGSLDVGVVRLFEHRLGKLHSHLLLREPYVAAVPAEHPLARRRRLRIRDLKGNDLVGFPRELQPALYDRLEERLRSEGLRFSPAYETTSKDEAIALVRAGIGCAIVPQSSSYVGTDVVFLPLRDGLPVVEVFAIHRPDCSGSVKTVVRTLRHHAAEEDKKRSAPLGKHA